MGGAGGWKMGALCSECTAREEELETEMREVEEPLLSIQLCSIGSTEISDLALQANCSAILPRSPSSFSGWRFTRGGGLALTVLCVGVLAEWRTETAVLGPLSLSYSSLLGGALRAEGLFSTPPVTGV